MKKRILIVEDEEVFVGTIQLFIRKAIRKREETIEIEYEVCSNYQQAVDTLKMNCSSDIPCYDLVIVDFKIPMTLRSLYRFPGLDICKLIREKFPRIPYLPISRLLKEVKSSSGFEDYKDDIEKAVAKENKEELASRIIAMLTQQSITT